MNRIKKTLLLSTLALTHLYIFAQIPDGYYSQTEGKNGSALKAALNAIIDGHHEVSYGDARYVLENADASLQTNDSLRTIYTYHKSLAVWDGGNTWNREHVWSKSKGFEIENLTNSYKGVGSDIHNLRACIPSINSAKNNRWFGPATEVYFYKDSDTGSKTITGGTDSDWVWEPRDEDKGDVARILFYMATRYEGMNNEVDLELIDYIPNDANTKDPIYAQLSYLLDWHESDPVDDFEKQRNEIIFQNQENRNPFIDHPEFAFPIFCISISDLNSVPSRPSTSDEVGISTKIFSQVTYESIQLRWGTSPDKLEQLIAMKNTQENDFISTENIPAHQSGSIYYQVEVRDEKGTLYLSDLKSYQLSSDFIYSEDFETVQNDETLSLQGWQNKATTGERQWIGKSYSGNKYAQFSSYNSDEENECWLITPVIAKNYNGALSIEFDINVGYWNHHGLKVYLSENYYGEDINTADWIDISNNFSFPNTPNDAYGIFQPAGNYTHSTSNEFNLAFVYRGNSNDETTTFQVDNIAVKAISTSIIAQKENPIYPNPAHDILFIGNRSTSAIKIVNHMGQEQPFMVNDFESLNIKNLQPGLYCLILYQNNENQKQSQWFIKH